MGFSNGDSTETPSAKRASIRPEQDGEEQVELQGIGEEEEEEQQEQEQERLSDELSLEYAEAALERLDYKTAIEICDRVSEVIDCSLPCSPQLTFLGKRVLPPRLSIQMEDSRPPSC